MKIYKYIQLKYIQLVFILISVRRKLPLHLWDLESLI